MAFQKIKRIALPDFFKINLWKHKCKIYKLFKKFLITSVKKTQQKMGVDFESKLELKIVKKWWK